MTVVTKSTGKVILCTQKETKKVYAMKIVEKDSSESGTSVNESRILNSIRHPFIVAMYCAYQSPKKIFMVKREYH